MSPPPTPPIRPNSHRINRTTRIVQSMIFSSCYLSGRGAYRLTRPPSLVVCRLKGTRQALDQNRHTYSGCNRHSKAIVAFYSQRFAVGEGLLRGSIRTAVLQSNNLEGRVLAGTNSRKTFVGKERCWRAIT